MVEPRIRVLPLRGLEPELRARWVGWAAGGSPFHHPRYHELVDGARRDHGLRRPEVAVLVDRGEPRAVLPFTRGPEDARDRGPDAGVPRDGHPSGHRLTDHQGWVGTAGPADLLAAAKAAGLATLRLDHLAPAQAPVDAIRRVDHSPVIDLRGGHAAYVEATHAARVEARKARRLEREIGPLRFEPFVTDPAARDDVLDAVVAWKSAQYRATDEPDLFAVDWCRTAVARVAAAPFDDGFGGAVSALWAGDRLVAAHVGLRAATTWHWWLPAYDPAVARHSPGTVLLLAMVEHAPTIGIDVVDLGKGEEGYKARLANRAIEVATAVVDVPSVRRTAERATGAIRRRLRRHRRA